MAGDVNWVQILQIGGLAGVISAIINGGVKEFFEWNERKRKARYLALRVSLILERYYHACADRAGDINEYLDSRSNGGSNEVGLPDLAEYPSDAVSWVYLDQGIADEVLSFPAELSAINEGIYYNVNMDFDPDGPNSEWTLEPLYEMAFKTISLARRVREAHGLSTQNRTKASEVRLLERQKHFLDKLEARRQAYAKAGSLPL